MDSSASPLDRILAVGRVVTEGRQAPEAIAARLGTISAIAGGTIYVNSSDPLYVVINVFFDEASRRVHTVSFRGAPGAPMPALAELKARLGDYVIGARTHFQAPLPLSFHVDFDASLDRTCTVYAAVSNGEQPVTDWVTGELSVIAETRLRRWT